MMVENEFRKKQQRNYMLMRRVRDIAMALIILMIGIMTFYADKLGFDLAIDPVIRYMFAGLCILYGGFRLYRGIKSDY